MKNFEAYYFKVDTSSDMEESIALQELGEFIYEHIEFNILFADGTKEEDEFFVFLPEYKVNELENILKKTNWKGFSKNITSDILMNRFQNDAFQQAFIEPEDKVILTNFRRLNLTKDLVLELILEKGIDQLSEIELEILRAA